MKSNPMISILMAILFINAAGTALLAYQYVRSVRHVQYLQLTSHRMQQEINLFTGLVKETIAYSQKHNLVIPPLKTLGITMRTNQASPDAKTSGK